MLDSFVSLWGTVHFYSWNCLRSQCKNAEIIQFSWWNLETSRCSCKKKFECVLFLHFFFNFHENGTNFNRHTQAGLCESRSWCHLTYSGSGTKPTSVFAAKDVFCFLFRPNLPASHSGHISWLVSVSCAESSAGLFGLRPSFYINVTFCSQLINLLYGQADNFLILWIA